MQLAQIYNRCFLVRMASSLLIISMQEIFPLPHPLLYHLIIQEFRIFTFDGVFNPIHSFSCTSLHNNVHRFPSVLSIMASPERPPRLLMVSNKTTVTIKRSPNGSYSFTQGSGGLISGVSGLSKTLPYTWYGWPGLEIPESEIAAVTSRLKDDFGSVPVLLDDELADRHYNGFASNVLLASQTFK